MASAEIITIGSELLLGVTQDTNTSYLLKNLREIGINCYRTQIIGDNTSRIASAIRESVSRVDIVLLTGGLGPTVDDMTRAAVAEAFNTQLVYHEELWQEILVYFTQRDREPSENNRRQAYLPENAKGIPNSVGTAPAFLVETDDKIVISLPGVPIEMKVIFENSVIDILRKKYPYDDTIKIRTLHTFGLGESIIDESVSEFETWSNPTLGLSAKEGVIDLRLTAKGVNERDASLKLDDLEARIRARLGDAIFGVDGESLPGVLERMLREAGKSVNIFEVGTSGKVGKSLDHSVYKAKTANPALSDEEWENGIGIQSEPGQIDLYVRLTSVENGFNKVQSICTNSQGASTTSKIYNPKLFSDQYFVYIALETLRSVLLDERRVK